MGEQSKMEQNKPPPPTEPKVEEGPNKRQSFISDFAALEKTYKILGISKGPDPSVAEESKKVATKKRHNSEGKIKNKDKVKAKRSQEELFPGADQQEQGSDKRRKGTARTSSE